MTCGAKIRPFRPINDLELACTLDEHDPVVSHQGEVRDHAFPGSKTVVSWFDDDRRSFRGEFRPCGEGFLCMLPAGHPRGCAE